ncbi:hypothetical protein BC828DRAFT_389937 [Blastocladiella britannica]|nr:hypothetical protein BC828DRAFT_389937 [Blastocladiella britannica]
MTEPTSLDHTDVSDAHEAVVSGLPRSGNVIDIDDNDELEATPALGTYSSIVHVHNWVFSADSLVEASPTSSSENIARDPADSEDAAASKFASSRTEQHRRSSCRKILGQVQFRPCKLSLDQQIQYRHVTQRVKRAVPWRTPSGIPTLKSSIKPFDGAVLSVYHYAPLTLADASCALQDPRRMSSCKSPAAALSMAPELFQQPWTFSQMLHAIRAPASAPEAWLAAVLDIHCDPSARDIDKITRWNAFGEQGVPSFGEGRTRDLVDSAIGLNAAVSLLGIAATCRNDFISNVNIASLAEEQRCRHVTFAATIVTKIAIIPSVNRGKGVKKRSMKGNPIVHAMQSGGGSNSSSNSAEGLLIVKEIPADVDQPRWECSHLSEGKIWVVVD